MKKHKCQEREVVIHYSLNSFPSQYLRRSIELIAVTKAQNSLRILRSLILFLWNTESPSPLLPAMTRVNLSKTANQLPGTAIELLEFRIDPLHIEDFLAIDREIWTTALAQNPAFLHKEIWLDPARPQIVTTVIHWSDREQWKAIAPELLADLASQFDKKFSRPYQLVGEREYINYSVSMEGFEPPILRTGT
jgi:uncharacterized protein (TIGR03792 family)